MNSSHINSIEKDVKGDYIISSRYCSTVYKISGQDGSIIWRLNGKSSDFTLVNFPNAFAFQHDPRILSQDGPVTVLSLFDNGSDGYNTTTFSSSGMIISVDTSTWTATLLNQYTNPPITTTLSTSQGSMQVLHNSNVFIGWGSIPQVSEFTENGDCVALGGFGIVNEGSSYRAKKISTSAWTGNPDSTPAIFTYANSTSLPTTFYVSWNGATEVASWRFYGGNTTSAVRLVAVGSAARSGFETAFTASGFFPYGFAEALDARGRQLGRSRVVPTFVPSVTPTPTNGTFPANGTTVGNGTTIALNGTTLSNSTATRSKRWGFGI
jgi:Arylsulfotransferase (ASST)